MDELNNATRRMIFDVWEKYTPDWYVNLLWNDMPTDAIKSSSHTRHLRNVILCKTSGVSKCSRIPELPNRVGMTCFQERTIQQSGKVTFHTHIHLFNASSVWSDEDHLNFFIKYVCGQKVVKLLKSDTLYNKGVVVKRWMEDYHPSYNFKENDRQKYIKMCRYTQDKDLLLDVQNSDFIPYDNSKNGYQRLLARSY